MTTISKRFSCTSQRTLIVCMVFLCCITTLHIFTEMKFYGLRKETTRHGFFNVSLSHVKVLHENSSDFDTNAELASRTTRIPGIMHQSWKTADHIPGKFVPWMQSWKNFNPTWQYVFWDDADNLKLFETHFPQYFHVASSIGKIHLADMTRYAIMYLFGGVYADGDFECLKPFDDLMHHDLFLSYEPFVHSVLLEGASNPVLCNAIMGSKPRHPFWLTLMDNIKHKFETDSNRDPVSLTGPRMVEATVKSSNHTGMSLLAEEYFYPEVAYWNMGNLLNNCPAKETETARKNACEWLDKYPNGHHTENTHAVHRWQCTWCRGDDTNTYLTLADIFPNGDALRPRFH